MIEILLDNSKFWAGDIGSWASYTMLLPILLGVMTFRSRSPLQKRLLLYIVASFIMQYFTTMRWFVELFDPATNAPYFHIGSIMLFGLIINVYKEFLRGRKLLRADLAFFSFYLVFATWNMIWGDGVMKFNSRGLGVYSFLIMLITLGYFFNLLRTLEIVRLERDPLFWGSAGFLVYCSGSFLLWLGTTYLLQDLNIFKSVYRIHAILLILLNISLTIALSINTQAADPATKTLSHGN